MPTYVSQQPAGPIRTIAFEHAGAARYGFVSVADATAAAQVQASVKQDPRQKLLSESANADGVLLVYQITADDALLTTLGKDGQTFAAPEHKKAFNPWAWRGAMSIIGQSGQLTSGWMVWKHAKQVFGEAKTVYEQSAKLAADNEIFDKAGKARKNKLDDSMALGGFAILNLCANAINIVFGAQEKSDPYQLAALKQQFNENLQTRYGNQAVVDAPDASLVAGKQKVGSFLQRHSVSFGEVFLRTLGTISLVFPVTRVKKACAAFRNEGAMAAFAVAKNDNVATLRYGLGMLTGKFISFTAREPDPYNPEPPSLIRTFREKVAFKLSSVIEGSSSAYAGYNRYKNQEIFVGNRKMPDYPGAFGNAVFVGGYGIRFTAPYGTREVYMPELYAHAGRAIAHLPATERAEAIASTAQWMAGHFAAEKKETYRLPAIYAALAKTVDHYAAAKKVNVAPTQPALASSALPALNGPSTRVGEVQQHQRLQDAPPRDRALA